MAIIRKHTATAVGGVTTSRLLTIDTIETVIEASTGAIGFVLTNNGPTLLSWATTGLLLQGSGTLLFPATTESWWGDPALADDFQLIVIADSAATSIHISEYLGGSRS